LRLAPSGREGRSRTGGPPGPPGPKGDPGTVVSGLGTLNGVPCIADEAQRPPPTGQAKLVIYEID